MNEEIRDALQRSDLIKYNWAQKEVNGETYYVSPGIDSLNDPLMNMLVKENFQAVIVVRYDDEEDSSGNRFRLIPVEKFIDKNKEIFEMKEKISDMTVTDGKMCVGLNLLVFQKPKYPSEIIRIINNGYTGNVYREEIERLTDYDKDTVLVTMRDIIISIYHQRRACLIDVLHKISISMNTLDEIDVTLCRMGIK